MLKCRKKTQREITYEYYNTKSTTVHFVGFLGPHFVAVLDKWEDLKWYNQSLVYE